MEYRVKLKIADIVIQMQSAFPFEQRTKEKKRLERFERFQNFFYKGRQKPHITIQVNIVDKLPEIRQAQDIFITTHYISKNENWRLLKKNDFYIYKCPLEAKKQLMRVNPAFDKVNAYLLPKKNKARAWNFTDIIYDFLQVLLINHLALRRQGIFTHSVGIKDLEGKGLLFTGKSHAGKTTLARLWYNHPKAMVLNDDRIIIRKIKKRFFIYSSPWHGAFSDYLSSKIESAPLEKIFFIYHSPENKIKIISKKSALNLLYPCLFPTFWDKNCLENIVSFCQDLLSSVPCYRLGFVNNKRVIGFVRKTK